MQKLLESLKHKGFLFFKQNKYVGAKFLIKISEKLEVYINCVLIFLKRFLKVFIRKNLLYNLYKKKKKKNAL